MAPVMLDTDAAADKVCKMVDKAAANGAKVIAFAEAMIPGYPWWIWLGNADYGMKYYIELYKNIFTSLIFIIFLSFIIINFSQTNVK